MYEDCLENLRQLIVLKEENNFDIREEVLQTGEILIKSRRTQEGLDVLYDLSKQLSSLGISDILVEGRIAETVSKAEMVKGNLAKAREVLDSVIEKLEKVVKDEEPDLYDVLARCYAQRGNIFALEKGGSDYLSEYKKAAEIYQKFVELVPQ